MKCYASEGGGRVFVIRLNKGDLLRESIEQVIQEQGIKDGTLVCGYGTLDRCTLHMINTIDRFPAEEDFPSWQEYPLELVSMTGIIADGEAHIHAVVSDKEKGGAISRGTRFERLGRRNLCNRRGRYLYDATELPCGSADRCGI